MPDASPSAAYCKTTISASKAALCIICSNSLENVTVCIVTDWDLAAYGFAPYFVSFPPPSRHRQLKNALTWEPSLPFIDLVLSLDSQYRRLFRGRWWDSYYEFIDTDDETPRLHRHAHWRRGEMRTYYHCIGHDTLAAMNMRTLSITRHYTFSSIDSFIALHCVRLCTIPSIGWYMSPPAYALHRSVFTTSSTYTYCIGILQFIIAFYCYLKGIKPCWY
jgi:hypothetical protein